jgi:Uma2 family endonuclease
MSSTAQDLLKRHRLTVRDYHRMGEVGILHEDSRVELIEGEIIDMAPIGSSHAGTVIYLSTMRARAVSECPIISIQSQIVLDEHSELEPDIALLHPRKDFYKSSHPRPQNVLLIVEVAESSLRYDREIKIPLYTRHSIPEISLVDLQHSQLSLYRKPVEGAY